MFLYVAIDDELQARKCLNLNNSNITAPSPVVLESSIPENFVCQDQEPLYVFSCTLYGNDVVWFFEDVLVTAFLPADPVGYSRSISYPESAPVYNITVILTQVSLEAISRYNAPVHVSILIVQTFSENNIEVVPFAVSCQTHCQDENRTEVCQNRNYKVAGMLIIIHVLTLATFQSGCHSKY